jgi:penicillin amidase
MFRKYPLTSRLCALVVLPFLVLVGMGWWHLRQSLPLRRGVLAVPGVSQEVRVERDAEGVPRIIAGTDRDAFFAMGFVHAQDRMWQLELQRRIAQGRLSEIFGKASVEQDIWFRTLGLDRSARSAWPALSPEAQISLQAYTDGINHWLSTRPVLPVEFAVFGIEPEPWTVYDSLAWVKVFALNLGGNYRREVERLLAGQVVEHSKLQALFPEYSNGPSSAIAALDTGRRQKLERFAQFQSNLASQLQIGGRYVGSNAWAVSGKLTGNGSALLANDPHLGLQIPSLWYMAAVKGDRIDAYGATLVGLPVVIFGRNQQVAWGGTNLMADAQDLYFEQVKPDDNSRYNVNGQWVAFESRDELIQVKPEFPAFLRTPLKPVRIHVRSSRHGPVISDMFRVFEQPVALRWTALEPGDTSYEAFFRMNYAADWPSFQEALHFQVAPALNLMYADRNGNIGQVAAGRIPIRRSGEGMIPAPGWTDEYEWVGAIPFEQWPRSYNPDVGYLVSANNKPVGDDYPYLITHDWAPPSRADRITALLQQAAAGGKPLDLAAMRRIQSDSQSEPARRLLARLLQHEPANDQQRRAFVYLRQWHGEMTSDSQAATIFNAWTRLLKQELLSDELKGDWNKEQENRYLKGVVDDIDLDTALRILTDDQAWCDDVGTEYRETCDDALDGSLNDALWELLKVTGDESMRSWSWGKVHETLYRHVPFSQTNLLRGFFERRVGNGGSPDSINVASYSFNKSGGYVQDFGAGVRQLLQLGPAGIEHLYMNSTGQSGNVMSSNYDDMIERFRNVDYLSLTASGDGRTELLTLMPGRQAPQGRAP